MREKKAAAGSAYVEYDGIFAGFYGGHEERRTPASKQFEIWRGRFLVAM